MILLKDIILILFLAVLIILIMSKFRISPVIGFLLTGIIIGPSALHLIKSISDIEILAEIGIVILLFTIGLEFSLDKIKVIKRYFFLFGSSQVILCWVIFFLLLHFYGLAIYQSLFGGFVLSLSSTAIVLKILQDNNELITPQGSKMTGILLFQDASIIPFLIIFPILFQSQTVSTSQLFLKMAFTIGGIIIFFLFGKNFFPKIFAAIIKLKIPELLIVTVFIFLFGTAILTHELGSTMAMGAFIAGIAISDSDFARQINTQIIPSRHIFNSIFFISIGMFINISFFLSHITEIFLITILIMTIKVIVIISIFYFFKYPLNEGLFTSFGLANIGEFSFILFAAAQTHIVFDQDIHQLLLCCTVLSMLSIPLFLKIGKSFAKFEPLKKKIMDDVLPESTRNHTVIAGYGINGQNISRILKTLNIPYTILETNPTTVKKYKELGEPIYYGDIEKEYNLQLMGITKASLLIIAISDIDASKHSIKLAKSINPKLKIIARTYFSNQVEELYNLGADLVLSQDIETSLTCIHHILKFYNMPEHIARVQTNLLRKEHYQFFVKKEIQESWKIAIFDFLEQDNELFFITPKSRHANQKMDSLAPFHFNSMKIIGIIRKDQILTEISKEFIIKQFDTIIFSGNHKKVAEAVNWMEDHN